MSDYFISDPNVRAGPITATHSAPQAPLGLIVNAIDRAAATSGGPAFGRFYYARGSNVASAGQFVQLQNGSAVLLASANSSLRHQVGVCPTVLSATNVYGWVQIEGLADYCRANASDVTVAAGVAAYLCATAGAVNPTAGIGSCVVGLVAPVSNASGTANSAAHKYVLNGACRVHGITASN
jgi:hypothetical protein